MERLRAWFERLLAIPYSPWLLVLPPIGVGSVRALEEALVSKGLARLDGLMDIVCFYAVAEVCFASLLGLLLRRDPRSTVGAVACGLAIGVLPPLVDLALPNAPMAPYRYLDEFHWHMVASYQPSGEVIVSWGVIALVGLFVGVVTRSWARGLAGLVGSYLIAQLTAWALIAAVRLFAGAEARSVALFDVPGFLLIALLLAIWHRRTIGPSLRRLGHALPWAALALIGARANGRDWLEALARSSALLVLFGSLIVVNDYFDREQDAAAGGQQRPVEAADALVASWLQALLLLWVAGNLPHAVAPLLICLAAATAHHLPALRWKRSALATAGLEGLTAAACLLFGVAREGGYPHQRWLPIAALLLLLGGAIVSRIKDYKDIEQDRAAGVSTSYTWLLDRGLALRPAHLLISLSASACLIVPVAWLALEPRRALLSTLVAAALIPAFAGALLLVRDRTRAVELALWLLSGYLVALAGTDTYNYIFGAR